jgi:hypothetical protein
MRNINPLKTQLNPICHLLALLGAHHILHVSGIRVNKLPSYITTEFEHLKKFKVVLQKFLYENYIYSFDEYFELEIKVKNCILLEHTYERLDMHALICLYI